MTDLAACPCGSGHPYAACCGPFHAGQATPALPEQLMRSRYSAFVLAQGEYLQRTHAQPSSEADLRELLEWTRSVGWLGLVVVDAPPPTGDEGVVAFEASYVDGSGRVTLAERSRFSRVAGRWLYVEGAPTQRRVKVERNAPCPCGSGKKYKQCHG